MILGNVLGTLFDNLKYQEIIMTVGELITELDTDKIRLDAEVVIQDDKPKNAKEYEIGPIYYSEADNKVWISPIK